MAEVEILVFSGGLSRKYLESEMAPGPESSGAESAGWENVKVTKPPGPSPSLSALRSLASVSFHSLTFSETGTAGVWAPGRPRPLLSSHSRSQPSHKRRRFEKFNDL